MRSHNIPHTSVVSPYLHVIDDWTFVDVEGTSFPILTVTTLPDLRKNRGTMWVIQWKDDA